MQLGDGPSASHALSAKDASMLRIAIAATLNRHGDLVLAVEQGRHAGISDAEIREILGEVLRRADVSVAESIRAVLHDVPQQD